MQMMGNSSDEGKQEGLRWIDASINKFDETNSAGYKAPTHGLE
jgi:imidazoleglycerol phosphate synthase glutamine amidotransferase subunit HisH